MKCTVCGKQISNASSDYCSICVDDYFQNCDIPLPQGFSARYGWICPRCGKVNSPDTRSCDCTGNKGNITMSSTISIPDDIKISLTETASNYET